MTALPPAERARRALIGAGLSGSVEVAGDQGEIAVLSIDGAGWEQLPPERARAVLAAVRAAGFRYVTVDLEA